MESAVDSNEDVLSDLVDQHQQQEKNHDAPPLPPETQTVDDVLELAVHDVGALIPAERSVLFVYDKSANQLKPQFAFPPSVHYTDTPAENAVAPSSTDHDKENNTSTATNSSGSNSSAVVTGFPPVMGMISACFLHKRCLRMQEPHPHRAFHRDYDAPKDMSVDSILCAPIILHHRVIGVIQLINRIDLDAAVYGDEHSPLHPSTLASRAGHHHHEDEREIKLWRLKTVKAHARIGFSSKDEQKLIQFASHVAHMVESKLKSTSSDGETQAALRNEHTKSALELLSMLNEKLDYQGNSGGVIVPISGPMPIRKKAVVVEQNLPLLLIDFEPPEQAPTPPPHSPNNTFLVPEIDPLLVAMAIVRVQAMFRGRRVRRAGKFNEALKKLRLQKQRLRSVTLIQRLTRGSIVRRQVRSQKQAVRLLSRAYNKFKFRAKIEVHMERRRTERPTRTVTTPAPPKSSKRPVFIKRKSVVPQEIDRFRGGVKSVAALQKRFRERQAYKAEQEAEMAVVRKLVKLQSFLRGSLVRKHVKELITRTAQSPTVVCLRIASSSRPGIAISNQLCHNEHHHHRPEAQRILSKGRQDQDPCCVYAMPERVVQAAHVSQKRCRATRHRLEEIFDQVRNPKAHATRAWDVANGSRSPPSAPLSGGSQANDDYAFGVELRRLTASTPNPMANESRSLGTRGSSGLGRPNVVTATTTEMVLTHRLSQAFPGFAFDPILRRKGKQSPPGVEFVSEVSPRRGLLDHQIPETMASNNGASARRPSTQQQQCHQALEPTECALSNALRHQAFYAAVGISRTEVRNPTAALPELLRGSHRQQLKRAQTFSSSRDQALNCCLLPAATGNTSKLRLKRDSRLSVRLGLSSQQTPSPKRPSTSATTTISGYPEEGMSPSALAPHRKRSTVLSTSVVP